MAARFEIGDPRRPRGHALLYFRSAADDEILATYVIVLPVAINPAKYIPPAFAAHLPHLQQAAGAVAATALPPIPEAMGSLSEVRRLAEVRADDLLDGGVVDADPERLLLATHETAQEYAARYRDMIDQLPAEAIEEAELDEDALRWALMTEKERIGELARLTGQLRYAVDGGDEHLIRATAAQMDKLRAHLPEKYRIGEFLAAARRPGLAGRRLAELYIDRCYKLSNEQYEALGQIDREIAELEGSSA